MLGNRRLCERQFVDDLAADTRLFARQQAKNMDASGMADGLGQLRQFLVGIRPFQSLEVSLRQRFCRWAADSLGLRIVIHSHSTINDITRRLDPSSGHCLPLHFVGIFNSRTDGFSIERLMRLLLVLGRDIEITVKGRSRVGSTAKLRVA